MSRKIKIILGISLSLVLTALLILGALTYIPMTRELRYEMDGYVIAPDGKVLEEFALIVYGKEYDFIIDPPGGSISFSGNELKKLQGDATILYFHWGDSQLAQECMYAHFIDQVHLSDQILTGPVPYYNSEAKLSGCASAHIDLSSGNFYMYDQDLMDGAFIIGVSDPEADPLTVIDIFREYISMPETESLP